MQVTLYFKDGKCRTYINVDYFTTIESDKKHYCYHKE
jgi:hypothetical protein